MSNYDKRLSRKAKLILIWEELFRLDSYLATFIYEGQKWTLYVCSNINAWETHKWLGDTCQL